MKNLLKGLALLLLSFLFCSHVSYGMPFDIDTLANNWRIVKYTEDGKTYELDNQSQSFLSIDTLNYPFKYEILINNAQGDTIHETGTSYPEFDGLYLLGAKLDSSFSIDSLRYIVKGGKSRIELIDSSQVIAYWAEGQGIIESQRGGDFMEMDIEEGFLVLKGKERTLYLKRQILKESEFSFWDILRGIFGIMVMIGIAYLFSTNRKAIKWRLVGIGMSLQLVIAILVLQVPSVGLAIQAASKGMVTLLNYSEAGAKFMFGDLADTESFPGLFAFQILPTIVFFSAIMSVLYYLGVLQRIVYAFAWIMSKTMRLSGAESLAAAGNIFVGQTEAPLLVKPYLDRMTRSEIMALMTGGFATIAGGVFAAYVKFLGGGDPQQTADIAKHLITASVMSAPAAIVMAKILVPETEEFDQDLNVPKEKIGTNILDALSNGITDGLKLAVNVGVMLMVFTAVMALLNSFFGNVIGEWTGLNSWVESWTNGRYQNFDLTFILGLVGAPFAWLMGVPNEDILLIGQLLGEKTILNEFYSYASLGSLMEQGAISNYKSVVVATYALCGFANFASIGIQIGGIGALSPKQRKNLSELSMRALLGGTFAAFLTASIAGMLIFV